MREKKSFEVLHRKQGNKKANIRIEEMVIDSPVLLRVPTWD